MHAQPGSELPELIAAEKAVSAQDRGLFLPRDKAPESPEGYFFASTLVASCLYVTVSFCPALTASLPWVEASV